MVDPSRRTSEALQLTAKLEDLEFIRKFIEQRASTLAVDSSTTYDIELAVTEMATNSLVHGYPEKRGWLQIDITRQDERIRVRVLDQAPEFDPTKILSPDLSLPLEKRGIGGLGIYLTRKVTESMNYKRLPDGKNEIVLVFLPSSPNHSA